MKSKVQRVPLDNLSNNDLLQLKEDLKVEIKERIRKLVEVQEIEKIKNEVD